MARSEAAYYDQLEVRDQTQRAQETLTALPGLLRHAIEFAPACTAQLSGIDPDKVTSFEALARLPLLRKAELIERQRAAPPFGGLLATPLARLAKVFASPGPIFEPESTRPDHWRMARAMFAAGFRAGDLVHNTFAYHLTPAGSMMESGARALGCPVIPAGTGQSEQQLAVIHCLQPVAYVGTPSFLKILLDGGRKDGRELRCFKKALVSGEACPGALAKELEREHGIRAYQCYGTADVGLIAYETDARDGLVVDEGVLVEIVRPGTGDAAADGEVGEVVVTAFNPDYPLIRFATGDLSAILPGNSPCGRTNRRLRGWLGRADQATKVRGMFVHPHQVAEVARRHAEIGRARLVVEHDSDRLDRMTLHCEVESRPGGLGKAIEASLRAVFGLRGTAVLVGEGTLANDGKVIDDRRETG
jgi:phenylacetate-CoA ligase